MVSLRTMWGIDLKYIENNFGISNRQNIEKEIQGFIETGEIIKTNGKIFLSNKGKLKADGIASELFL